VEDRIEAAGILKDCGLEVRVRIDPMVPVDNWADYYVGLLESIFERLVPDRITIGSLRGLQSTINNSKDRSWTNYLQERSNWGLKIPIRVRTEMYHLILDTLREDYKYTKVALCKETRGVWDQLALDYRHIRCNCTQ
jgi:spore photoproduct lyase